eukprot:TRINITY_DN12180_c0_g1_i1.p1 TRINITY_DN12180_c0_g1~~TRINITY_DN12180_c0_g1_i1.p1  ORF type:complete len:529 (+),score=94.93 TRINITY_DN12180_c0_g1_i1:111-1697(+)
MMLRTLAVVVVMAQLSGAFRKKVRGAVRSSTEPKALLVELEQALGTEEWALHDLHEIEEHLKDTFKALPKNGRGAVEAPSARYALHRFFIQQYGWMVKGLGTNGTWDAESPVMAMGDGVPAGIRELFEDRLCNYGLNLHELAVLAATMNKMFEWDVERRLRIVYTGMGYETNAHLTFQAALHDVMLTYMAVLVSGPVLEELTVENVKTAVSDMRRMFPRAAQAEQLLNKIANEVAAGKNRLGFDLVLTILIELGQKIGALEDTECQAMKNLLVSAEHREGSGRVRLGTFYTLSHHFSESAEYLRAVGVLDESDPEDPKVLIPNYLANPSNCVTPSGQYSVCCFDECEDLMDQIEKELAAPMGTPDKIISIVSSLGSSNATLSPNLLQLLVDVAGHHDGMIPIHGRLLSQWLHQTYPRECQFPHATGVAARSSSDMEVSSAAFADRIKYLALASQSKTRNSTETNAPMWTMHEELVDKKTFDKHIRRVSFTEDLLLFGTVGFVGFMLAKMKLEPLLKNAWYAQDKMKLI